MSYACKATEEEILYIRRESGKKGDEALKIRDEFVHKRLDTLWKETTRALKSHPCLVFHLQWCQRVILQLEGAANLLPQPPGKDQHLLWNWRIH